MDTHISIRTEPFEPEQEAALVYRGNPGIGGVVSFLGLMRDMNEGDAVQAMTLEHYPGMTERALHDIVAEAAGRWRLSGVRLVHRVGPLRPCDPIVLVVVASAHRGEAFRACEFIIDFLKTRAPFWKKESTPQGERWVAERDADQRAEQRWVQANDTDATSD